MSRGTLLAEHPRIGRLLAFVFVVCFVLHADAAEAPGASPQFETPAPGKSVGHKTNASATGYLEDKPVDFRVLLPPPAMPGSKADDSDVAALRQLQVPADSARWQTAHADARFLYDRFSGALGVPLNRDTVPRLIQLLNRVERDVQVPTFDAKKAFGRLRPHQRFAFDHVCGASTPPKPDPSATRGSSYPSGHAAYGWAAALILADVASERAAELLTRGREYGESRIVCAVHFPSDVEAGKLVATAVVNRLYGIPEFVRDMEGARQEYRLVMQRKSN